MAAASASILVIKLGAFGDFMQALGPMKAIRAHHRSDRITLLTTKPFEELAQQSGYFDEVWIDTRPKWHDVRAWLDLRYKLNKGNFTRIYDLQNNDRTSFYLKLFNPRPEWVGVARGASHRNASKERTAGKAFDGHVQTLALAGITNIEVDDLSWMKGKTFANIQRPYVLIVPGSAAKHPEKRWPAAKYIALCKKIVERGYQPVLIGGETEKEILKDIQSNIPSSLNLYGQTSLGDIADLARNASCAIGNDTGPMHVIAQAGCKTIVLFSGKTQPHRHAPVGPSIKSIQMPMLKDLEVEKVFAEFNYYTQSL